MSRSLRFSLALALLLPLAAACKSDPVSAPLPPETKIEETTFAPELGIDLATFTKMESGVYYKDLVVGTGDSTAAVGKKLSVHYKGWLPNGTLFDQSSPDYAPFEFTIGQGKVIQGWELGTVGMKVGGHRILIIPPHLGYGYQASSRIPSNSVLVFRIDVYDIE